MDWKEILFGCHSRAAEIEAEWRAAKKEIQRHLNGRLRPLEMERDRLAGIAESEALPFNVRLERLNEVERQMSELQNEAADAENAAWFRMMDAMKNDEMASANIFRRLCLWLYWHA